MARLLPSFITKDPIERESAVMLIKAIIGAAALVFPRCFQRAGIVPSTLALIVAGCAGVIVGDLLMETRRALGYRGSTFRDMAVTVSGSSWGGIFLDATVTLQSFGTLVGYIVACGDLVSSSLRKAPFYAPDRIDVPFLGSLRLRVFSLLMLTTLVFFPLCLLRRLESLQTMAASTIVIYAFFLLVLFKEAGSHVVYGDLAHLFHQDYQAGDVMPSAPLNWFEGGLEGLFKVLPIIALSYSCVPLMIEVRRNVERRISTPAQVERSWHWVSNAAFCASGFFYIATGLLGYTAFRGSTHANVLSNLETLGVVATTVNILFAASLVISYPLICFVVREPVRRVILFFVDVMSCLCRRHGGAAFELLSPIAFTDAPSRKKKEGMEKDHVEDGIEGQTSQSPSSSLTTASTTIPTPTGTTQNASSSHHHHHDDINMIVFTLEAIIVTGGTFVAAVAVPGIDVVLELIGGTAAVIVSYVIPVALFFMVRPHTTYRRDKVKAAMIGIAGVLIGVLTCWNLWKSLHASTSHVTSTVVTSPPIVVPQVTTRPATAIVAAATAGTGVKGGESILSSGVM